jgi:hypothetical protein
MRKNDIVTTFNWDPLLVQAYLRSAKSRLSIPRIHFLHGNIAVGFCKEHRISGLIGRQCSKCNKLFQPSKLLYPITKKNYASDEFIANEWRVLRWGLRMHSCLQFLDI